MATLRYSNEFLMDHWWTINCVGECYLHVTVPSSGGHEALRSFFFYTTILQLHCRNVRPGYCHLWLLYRWSECDCVVWTCWQCWVWVKPVVLWRLSTSGPLWIRYNFRRILWPWQNCVRYSTGLLYDFSDPAKSLSKRKNYTCLKICSFSWKFSRTLN